MKIEQVSEHIWSLKAWLLIPVHVWVVVDGDGVTLVDAGLPFMASGILKLIDRLNAGPLQRILLTHGHSDHVGSVKRILNSKSVPVYAHRIELPYMEGERPYPRRKKPESNLAKGLAQPLGEDQGANLAMVAGLKPYLTPGHSPGHVVYYHEQDQVLLAGDLFTAKNGKLRRPMPIFTADMAEALRSSTIVSRFAPSGPFARRCAASSPFRRCPCKLCIFCARPDTSAHVRARLGSSGDMWENRGASALNGAHFGRFRASSRTGSLRSNSGSAPPGESPCRSLICIVCMFLRCFGLLAGYLFIRLRRDSFGFFCVLRANLGQKTKRIITYRKVFYVALSYG